MLSIFGEVSILGFRLYKKVNYPQTVEELIHWDISAGQDSFGNFTIITGFEGTGGCFWCGKELEGRRRYCGHHVGCWTLYNDYFSWNSARFECIKRYDYKCANCGVKHRDWDSTKDYSLNLEAHHIIPLLGEYRAYSPYNVPWNLICLCHKCHQEIHTVMRELAKPAIKDMFELALERGQPAFDIMRC